MKLTIIPADGAVYKDNVSFSGLDLSSAPADVHALQWDNNAGWIEFKTESEFCKPPNENITTLPDWVNAAVTKWESARLDYEAAEAAALAKLQSQKIPVTILSQE
jgi:hypothetical protein